MLLHAKPESGYPSIPNFGPSVAYPDKGMIYSMEPVEIGRRIRDARDEKGMSQEELGALSGAGQSTIGRIENGDFKRMPSAMPKIAGILGLALHDLELETAPNIGAEVRKGLGDFPVYSSAEGGPGEVIRSAEAMDWVPRPAIVQHVKTAYGMLISGHSMEPEFRPGETALVNPAMPIVSDEVYIFYRELHGEARAMIKHLRRATDREWHLTQWNPPAGGKKEFILSRKEWGICHRVVGKHSRR